MEDIYNFLTVDHVYGLLGFLNFILDWKNKVAKTPQNSKNIYKKYTIYKEITPMSLC